MIKVTQHRPPAGAEMHTHTEPASAHSHAHKHTHDHACSGHCSHEHHEHGQAVDIPSDTDLYTALNHELMASRFGASASEAHGIASGLCCRAIPAKQLPETLGAFGLTAELDGAFGALLEIAARDLSSADFAFDLWLPDTDDLHDLTPALGQWCHGFLLGFCFDGDRALRALSTDDQSTVHDIIAISGAMTDAEEGDQGEAVAFMEVREYVRMAVQNLFETLNPDAQVFPEPH